MTKPNEAKILTEFIEGLTEASGSAWQLCHLLQDPRFLAARDLIDAVKAGCIDVAVRPTKG